MVGLARERRRLAPVPTIRAPEGGMSSPSIFVVEFEHAHRAYRCIRLEGSVEGESPSAVAHWIVTTAGRTVWSFNATAGDTRESVQRAVEDWLDHAAAK
jgi:hypothetical protein